MNGIAKTCSCCRPVSEKSATSIDGFAEIRDSCPALRGVFLPDTIWLRFRDWHTRPDEVACHRSVLLLAFQRGYLARVTSPIHRYLLNGEAIRHEVRPQYLRDLQEKWMLNLDPIVRHRESRSFRGRVAELQCAEWLDSALQTVVGLEALGAKSDIETKPPDGSSTAIEVKFIGGEDADFGMILRSLAGRPAAHSVSPYAATNYLLFRAYEAAKQLRTVEGNTRAVLIVDDITWGRFQRQLEIGWIQWDNPRFVGEGPQGWAFIDRKRYPNFPNDLAATIGGIDAIWIVRQSSGFDLRLAYEFRTRST